MQRKNLPSLYMITNQKLYGLNNRSKIVRKALSRGVRLVQLREKDLSLTNLYALAEQIKHLCAEYRAKLVINSHVDIALSLNLDGVHLPQTGISVKEARDLLGPKKLIGQSTHSFSEAQRAQKEGADFITFGPIFETPSKLKYGNPLGLKKLETLCQKIKIPVYALGGLSLSNLPQIQSLGAHGLAGIRTFIKG